jgi:2-polyprenyl-6-methoxyphenol hydroxylase-like FAD-dependent oxidoreductase
MSKRRALVIGGSIGGLFAANWLRKIGWDVAVFERVEDDLASRGAGIGTHDELRAVIRRLGLPVEDIGVWVRERVCVERDGRISHRLATEQLQSSWARVYRLLKDALPAENYRFGMALERVEQDADGITAIFADGSRDRGDLLVGADGVRSTVRGLLLPEAQPRYAGYVAWRGIVDEATFVSPAEREMFARYTMAFPDGEMILCYPVPGRDNDTRPGRRGYNHIWYRPTEFDDGLRDLCTDASGRCHGLSIPPPLIRPEIVSRIKADAHALLAPEIAAVVERTTQLFFQAIFDLESPTLALGRAVLLGDAAFVARPHVGVGVTKAAIDAECLAREIEAAGDNLPQALSRYDRERRLFGSRIVARARRLGAYIEAQLKPPAERTTAERQPAPDYLMREIGTISLDINALTA